MGKKTEYIQKKGKPDMYDVAGPTHKGENEAIKDLDQLTRAGAVAGAATNTYSQYNKKMIQKLKMEK